MAYERIARMLLRRPPQGKFREQLFWLVDVIYACKSSGDEELASAALVVEDALGRLGEYLETGDLHALEDATARVESFARTVKAVMNAQQGPKE
jgi:hypothetical protein